MENLYTGPDVACKAYLDMWCTMVDQYVAARGRLTVATEDRPAALSAWIESTEHPDVVKLREQLARIHTRMQAIAEEAVPDTRPSAEEIGKVRTEVSELASNLSTSAKAIKLFADHSADGEAFAEAFEKMQALIPVSTSGRGRPPGQPGSSIPRPSVNVYLRSSAAPEGAPEETYLNLSAAATRLALESTVTLTEMYAKEAGVKLEDVSKVTSEITFSVTPPGTNTEWSVRIAPKIRTKSPGRPKGSKNKAA